MPAFSATNLSTLTYPRTGKRGVPQQFPRRLYEMLQSETGLESSAGHHKIICWSESGRAFRIIDVALFASEVLPKYFRTNKFSSFQRNLNLYGFSKVRRGPDTDMYAHPAFVRGQPESLSQLRKCTSAAARKRMSAVFEANKSKITIPRPDAKTSGSSPRSVAQAPIFAQIVPAPPQGPMQGSTMVWPQFTTIVPAKEASSKAKAATKPVCSKESGKLNLLAMAMTSMAERDELFLSSAPTSQHA